MLSKILKISQLFNKDQDPINYDDNGDEYRNYYYKEMNDCFYILQNKEKINFENILLHN